MRARDTAALGTIRLILAKLKDVDIAARTEASREGVADDKILSMMQGMIKQRNESIALYEKGNRADLADKEKAEIAVIERFLPQQMDEAAVEAAVTRGHRRGRRHVDQGHGRGDGGAEGQVRRPDGLRQGLGRGEEGSRAADSPRYPLLRAGARWPGAILGDGLSPGFLDELRARLSLSDVVGRKVSLKRRSGASMPASARSTTRRRRPSRSTTRRASSTASAAASMATPSAS